MKNIRSCNKNNNYAIRGMCNYDNSQYIVSDLPTHQSLRDIINSDSIHISFYKKCKWMIKIYDLIKSYHDNKIHYLELRPENIYITENWKIILFPMGSYIINSDPIDNVRYTPSEVLSNSFPIDKYSDLYGWGCIFYELMTKQKIYKDIVDIEVLKQKIIQGVYPEIPEFITQSLFSVFMKCWDKEAKWRENKFYTEFQKPESESNFFQEYFKQTIELWKKVWSDISENKNSMTWSDFL